MLNRKCLISLSHGGEEVFFDLLGVADACEILLHLLEDGQGSGVILSDLSGHLVSLSESAFQHVGYLSPMLGGFSLLFRKEGIEMSSIFLSISLSVFEILVSLVLLKLSHSLCLNDFGGNVCDQEANGRFGKHQEMLDQNCEQDDGVLVPRARFSFFRHQTLPPGTVFGGFNTILVDHSGLLGEDNNGDIDRDSDETQNLHDSHPGANSCSTFRLHSATVPTHAV